MDAKGRLEPARIAELEEAFVREVAASSSRDASAKTTFDYAWALSRSADRADWERCVPLFEDLLSRYPEYRRDCHFFLAETHFKLGAYRAARLHNDALLADEPRNQQALQLRERIEHQLTQEGALGLGLVASGAAAVALTVGLAFLFRRR